MTDENEDEHMNVKVSNVDTYQDTVSFYIYDAKFEDGWIRSDITIKQTLDSEGFEELSPYDWKEQNQK